MAEVVPFVALWEGIPWKLSLNNKTVIDNAVVIQGSNEPAAKSDDDVVVISDSGSVIVISDSEDDCSLVHTQKDPIIVTCCGYDLHTYDLSTLKPYQWLNDQIVNAYMQLLMSNTKNIFITNTFFYIKLQQGDLCVINKWLKNINFFNMSKILIPIHLPSHWSLVSIEPCRQKIRYYDSLGICNPYCIKKLKYFILKLAAKRDKRLRPHWKCCHMKNIPRQDNTSDCGVFICQYARCICQGYGKIPFSSKDMIKLRRQMLKEITQCRLSNNYFDNNSRWRK